MNVASLLAVPGLAPAVAAASRVPAAHSISFPQNGRTSRRISQKRAPDPSTEISAVQTRGLSVLIVDDCCLYREGLASIIAREPDVAGIRCAHDWPSILCSLDHDVPDVVLVNLACMESHFLMAGVRDVSPSSLIIAIGVEDAEDEILACAEAGVSGYLLRSEPFSHLMELVRHVVAGEAVCSPRVTAAIMRRLADLASERRRAPPLTEREAEILRLLESGLSNQQIADRLCIEVRTVKNHLHNLFGKLGVSRRGEAVAVIRSRRGLLGQPRALSASRNLE
jgi:DNA-binding NarL/FixJ family response regulator